MTRRAITRADEASIRARVGEACPAIEQTEPDLTILGLKELYALNQAT